MYLVLGFFFPYPTHQLFPSDFFLGRLFLNSCLNRLPCCFVGVLMEGCFMLGGGAENGEFSAANWPPKQTLVA